MIAQPIMAPAPFFVLSGPVPRARLGPGKIEGATRVLTTHRKVDGSYEVFISSWWPEDEEVRELEALIEAATRMGVLIRVCHRRDRSGRPCPAKVLLSVDPSTIDT
jgi:hypothetical protein